MNRSDPNIFAIQEFKSKPGDAGAAIGCMVWQQSVGKYVVHSFIHKGGPDPELDRFWGHYDLEYRAAMEFYFTKCRALVKQEYRPYRFNYDQWVTEQATQLADEFEQDCVDQEQLDEVVHEMHGATAAAINNEGLQGQAEYLIRELGVNDARDQLKNAVPADPR